MIKIAIVPEGLGCGPSIVQTFGARIKRSGGEGQRKNSRLTRRQVRDFIKRTG
jgi:hypothetical protein